MSFSSGDNAVGDAAADSDGQRLEVLRAVLTRNVDFPIVLHYRGEWLVYRNAESCEKVADESEAKSLADRLRSQVSIN